MNLSSSFLLVISLFFCKWRYTKLIASIDLEFFRIVFFLFFTFLIKHKFVEMPKIYFKIKTLWTIQNLKLLSKFQYQKKEFLLFSCSSLQDSIISLPTTLILAAGTLEYFKEDVYINMPTMQSWICCFMLLRLTELVCELNSSSQQ